MSIAPVLIVGYGNPGRGDDALGPELVARLEALLNHIEVAIRAFDPCLSCATHALGQMPLAIELVDAGGVTVGRLARGSEAASC